MPASAWQEVLKQFGDIRIAYGQSDEYSFVFNKSCDLYGMSSQSSNHH